MRTDNTGYVWTSEPDLLSQLAARRRAWSTESVTILHFCSRAEWDRARIAGVYATETLATAGFIHCSTAEQVHLPANLLARGRTDLVLLEIDETQLPEPPRWESDPSDPRAPAYPHVYGPIPVAAVVAAHDFPPDADGRFHLPPAVTATGGTGSVGRARTRQ